MGQRTRVIHQYNLLYQLSRGPVQHRVHCPTIQKGVKEYIHPELSTRQFCRANVTMFSGHKVVGISVSDPDPDWIRIQSGLWIRIQGQEK